MSKFNDLRKRGISLLIAAFTVVSLSGCSSVPEDYPEEFSYVEQDANNFSNFNKTVIKNGEPVTVYSGKNIFLAFNKENYDVKENEIFMWDVNFAAYESKCLLGYPMNRKLTVEEIEDIKELYKIIRYLQERDIDEKKVALTKLPKDKITWY